MEAINILAWSYSLCALISGQAVAEQIILDFGQGFDLKAVQASNAKVEVLTDDGRSVLRVSTGHEAPWPGVTIKAPKGKWNLSDHTYLALDIENVGSNSMAVYCRVDNPGADGVNNCITESVSLKPGQKKVLKVVLRRRLPEDLSPKLFGMRGYPGGLLKEGGIDATAINQFILFVNQPMEDHSFQVSNVRAGGTYASPEWLKMDEEDFFPLIDEYGQFIHKDWLNKIKSDEDFHVHGKEEAADLAQNPGADGWNKYGGWQAGPQLRATGFFRTEKYKGKWWLVDPEGRLFWSHGIDCVITGNATTPISDREHFFKALPEKDSPFAKFYGSGSWAPHGYYADKGNYRTYNFTGANLLRKYGENWDRDFAEISHRRLRSWGMNTIANWSSGYIYGMRKTPYVVNVGFSSRELEGSKGYWGKFRDVFDPSFKESVRKALAWQKDKTAGDPWCIGYFVDNEIAWGDEISLAVAALLSPPDQPAKKVFVEDLKAKYKTIDKLNGVWGTDYASWDALLQNTDAPDKDRAKADLQDFYTKTAEVYFKTCLDAVKEVSPNGLYLGCRFAGANSRAVRAAGKYCDVISFNIYSQGIGGLNLPPEVDKPVIIGEFHFGALDRGMFHTGLRRTENQDERAKAYKNYVQGALEHPAFVGTHWFQYGDQATTGRGDGENYQIGFLDVADTPYAETIRACREVGYNMYEHRLNTP